MGCDAETQLHRAWHRLTGHAAPPVSTRAVAVAFGRELRVRCGPTPQGSGEAVVFVSFHELCARQRDGTTLGAPDFLALAKAFPVVVLALLPPLLASQRDEARRLVILIDTLYEARVRLVVAAAGPPQLLFAPLLHADQAARRPGGGGGGGGGGGEPDASRTSCPDDHRAALLTVEEKMMFRRAVSRLCELCGTATPS